MIINNRKDLDAAFDDERTRFIAQISGTIHKWRWDDTEWAQYVDASSIERFEFTLADFPDAPVPDKPDYNPGDAVKEAERQAAKSSRDTALNAMVHTFADGRVVQVRPNDLPNFQTAIEIGSDQNWVMADNTTRITTVDEMQDAVNSAIVQAQVIWAEYAEALNAL